MAWNGLTILQALADGPLLTRQIAAVLGKASRDVTGCLGSLSRRGLILSVEGVHELTAAGRQALSTGREITSGPCGGSAASRSRNNLRAKAWRVMQMLEGFGVDDLLTMLCDGEEGDAERNLTSYVHALEAAGYLASLRSGRTGKPRWRLKRERAGVEPPAWNKATRVLRDHNTGEAFTIPRKREARHAA
ncbi:hypothetical protein NNJEOMEG_02294 [Fundidesulfovibrio magnetotacticus]|uniref:Uncharacterized protein n=1 Tax=Fundidesulfovibrio magnetotacticus TaxID=2730080 RepID=A0A6V8LWJ9_9BACT|nr:winged helix-turn-helix domain-containing protein [Fundidesulfovibrio magnetotacticus]GFK94449.1 hypothetical protein NNJEOMEG_02294 [Fundidesulfovibrio magnetotacticus]